MTRHRLETPRHGDRRRLVARVVLLSVLATGVAVVGVDAQRLLLHHPRPGGPAAVPSAATHRVHAARTPRAAGALRWVRELDRLDRIRARAWSRGDVERLRSVYAPGSAVLVVDRRHLRSYLDRGFTVRGVRLRLLAVRVVHRRRAHVRLAVVDRLGDAIATAASGRRVPLPHDRPRRHIVELRRVEGSWRIAEIDVWPGSR